MQASQAAPLRQSTFNLASCIQQIAERKLSRESAAELSLSTLSGVHQILTHIADAISARPAERFTSTADTRDALLACASLLEAAATISSLSEVEYHD